MSGWMVWIIDCYSAFFFSLFVVGATTAFFGMLLLSSDLIDSDLEFINDDSSTKESKKKATEKRKFINKISIILVLCGIAAIAVVIFAPSREAFIYMMNIDSEQLRQIYDITIRHYR